MIRRAVALLLAVVLGLPQHARADEPHPLVFDPDRDPAILATAGFAWIAGTLMQPTFMPRPGCDPCLAADVNPLDRFLAGQRNDTADKISWVMLAALLAAPIAADGIDVARSGGTPRSFADDLGVYLEALAVDGAVNQAVKVTARRPRPLAYDPTLPADARASSETYVSFYSEHASLAFTAAAAWVTMTALRHPGRRGIVAAVAAVAGGLAAATAALRMVAGKHFLTDVAAGAAAGTAVGVAVPMLHRRAPRIALVPVEGGALLSLSVVR